jgi:hypothetical protein
MDELSTSTWWSECKYVGMDVGASDIYIIQEEDMDTSGEKISKGKGI